MFWHEVHDGVNALDQAHVKTENAVGGGGEVSPNMGLVMRTSSVRRLTASPNPTAPGQHRGQDLVRNPLETSKNQII